MIIPSGSFTGNYEASAACDLTEARLVVAHEFGTPKPKNLLSDVAELRYGAANVALAEFIADRAWPLPVYGAEFVTGALADKGVEVAAQLEKTQSNILGTQGGTWEELRQATDHFKQQFAVDSRDEEELAVLHVGVAHHISRIARQSARMGLRPLLPPSLPLMFDRQSDQIWTRNKPLWRVREAVGHTILLLSGRM